MKNKIDSGNTFTATYPAQSINFLESREGKSLEDFNPKCGTPLERRQETVSIRQNRLGFENLISLVNHYWDSTSTMQAIHALSPYWDTLPEITKALKEADLW